MAERASGAAAREARAGGAQARHRGEQGLRVGVLRVLQHRLGAALLHQPAALEHRDVVGDLGHHAEIVGDEQDAHAAPLLQVADQLEDLGLGGDVERRGRLVGDEDRGFEGERHGDHRALALAAGELVRVGPHDLRRVGQADLGRERHRPGPALGRGEEAVRLEHLGDLVADAHHRVERRHRLLEHHGDAAAAQGRASRARPG